MRAKGLSLSAQLIGAVWIAAWSAYRFLKGVPTVREIVVSGLCIAAVFSPVYFNLVMDKFVARIEKKEE
jgi:hypothetical protein